MYAPGSHRVAPYLTTTMYMLFEVTVPSEIAANAVARKKRCKGEKKKTERKKTKRRLSCIRLITVQGRVD